MLLILSSNSKTKSVLSPLLGIPLYEIIGFFAKEPALLISIVISKKPLKDIFTIYLIDCESSPTLILPSTSILPTGALSMTFGFSPGYN